MYTDYITTFLNSNYTVYNFVQITWLHHVQSFTLITLCTICTKCTPCTAINIDYNVYSPDYSLYKNCTADCTVYSPTTLLQSCTQLYSRLHLLWPCTPTTILYTLYSPVHQLLHHYTLNTGYSPVQSLLLCTLTTLLHCLHSWTPTIPCTPLQRDNSLYSPVHLLRYVQPCTWTPQCTAMY